MALKAQAGGTVISLELNLGPRAPVLKPTSMGGGSRTNQDPRTRTVCRTRQDKSDLTPEML